MPATNTQRHLPGNAALPDTRNVVVSIEGLNKFYGA